VRVLITAGARSISSHTTDPRTERDHPPPVPHALGARTRGSAEPPPWTKHHELVVADGVAAFAADELGEPAGVLG
jgi:hypothetical protein